MRSRGGGAVVRQGDRVTPAMVPRALPPSPHLWAEAGQAFLARGPGMDQTPGAHVDASAVRLGAQGVRGTEQQSWEGLREPLLQRAEAQPDRGGSSRPRSSVVGSGYFPHFEELQVPVSKDIFASS